MSRETYPEWLASCQVCFLTHACKLKSRSDVTELLLEHLTWLADQHLPPGVYDQYTQMSCEAVRDIQRNLPANSW